MHLGLLAGVPVPRVAAAAAGPPGELLGETVGVCCSVIIGGMDDVAPYTHTSHQTFQLKS